MKKTISALVSSRSHLLSSYLGLIGKDKKNLKIQPLNIKKSTWNHEKTMKNQPGTMKNHENPPRTMKNNEKQ